MVHGILQFTPSIAFRYVLHRCESRDIRCRESFVFTEEARVPPTHAADGARGAGCRFEHSLALSAPGFVGRPPRAPGRARRGRGGGARAECRSTPPARAPRLLNAFAGSFCCAGFDNDPSAGSPTETLLQLLLPLNDKVQWTSRDVVGSEPPRRRDPNISPDHSIGRSDGRQIAPPTKNGHAPPPIESRKSSQSVNPYYVWTWYAAQETDFEQAYIVLAPRLRWQAGQDVAARAGIQPDRTCRTQLTRHASKCSVDARPALAPTPGNRCRALLPMRTLQGLKQVPLDTIARPVGGAEEMKARSAHARAPATTAAGARQRIGLGRMRAAPGARPEGSIQDLPLAR
ncbi:hypothetical protein CQW23_33056 [Capsicum baccatum]|uniref:Uncharacterized protein n=1 Tax=Capsicum baccatum TaxID=33114 RepID=A0A2G2V307_CAPBA|nr:hypothetical protein CQW23_33056 [Capsicum baccatum]